MAMYLGSKKVAVTNTVEKQVPSMKAFFEAGGKCQGSDATSFDGLWQYDDTANVTDMSHMFKNCTLLKNTPLLNTSKVNNMKYMFGGDYNIITAQHLDLQNVKDTSHMFRDCNELTSVSLSNTSKVTNMTYMFYNCYKLTTIPQLDTSSVTNMANMFNGCQNLAVIPQFDTSNVTIMESMFNSCMKLKIIPQFDISKVANAEGMFLWCSNLEIIHMININANLDISPSKKFTREALLEIIGNLKAQTSGSKKLTMGATNLSKLTDEDKAIATNKGWTLA